MEMAQYFSRHPGGGNLPLADLLCRNASAEPIDPVTHHTALPVLMGQVRSGAFQVLHRQHPVAGGPHPTRPRRLPEARSALRVVT